MNSAPRRGPVLRTPYEAPADHWRLDAHGRTLDIRDPGRRPSLSRIEIPEPGPRRRARPLPLAAATDRVDADPAARVEPHRTINQLRGRLDEWRDKGWPGVSRTTRKLLDRWSSPPEGIRSGACRPVRRTRSPDPVQRRAPAPAPPGCAAPAMTATRSRREPLARPTNLRMPASLHGRIHAIPAADGLMAADWMRMTLMKAVTLAPSGSGSHRDEPAADRSGDRVRGARVVPRLLDRELNWPGRFTWPGEDYLSRHDDLVRRHRALRSLGGVIGGLAGWLAWRRSRKARR